MRRGCLVAFLVWILGAIAIAALGIDRGSWTGVPLLLVAGAAGVVAVRLQRQRYVRGLGTAPGLDRSPLSEEERQWLDHQYKIHQSVRSTYYGPPETQMQGALQMLEDGHVGAAMIFAQRSLNTVEDTYRYGQMVHRTPSAADAELIAVLLRCLDTAIQQGHKESAREVAGAAHQNLELCADAAERAGYDHSLYASGVQQLEERFPGLEGRSSF